MGWGRIRPPVGAWDPALGGMAPTRVSVLSNRFMTWVMKVFILLKSEPPMLPEPSTRKTMSEAFVGQPGGGGTGGGGGKDEERDPAGRIYPHVRSSPTRGTHLPFRLVFPTPYQPTEPVQPRSGCP